MMKVQPIENDLKCNDAQKKFFAFNYISIAFLGLILLITCQCVATIILYRRILNLEALSLEDKCLTNPHSSNGDKSNATNIIKRMQEKNEIFGKSDKTFQFGRKYHTESKFQKVNKMFVGSSAMHSSKKKRDINIGNFDVKQNLKEEQLQREQVDKSWLQLTSYSRIPVSIKNYISM